MRLRALIFAALVALPGSASALSIAVPPDCVEGETEYFLNGTLAKGHLIVASYTPGQDETQWLISCLSEVAVRVEYRSNTTAIFADIVHDMSAAKETYTFQDVAERARNAGFAAKRVAFAASSCICNLGDRE